MPIRRCSTRDGGASRAAGSCCASRTSTSSAARRNSRRASIAISPGSASTGRAGAPPVRTFCRICGRLLDRLIREELVYPAFMSRGEMRAHIAARRKRRGRTWPRDPDGVPLYPGLDKALAPRERRGGWPTASPSPGGWTWPPRWRALGRALSWTEFSGRRHGFGRSRVEARPQDWGDVVLARRDMPTSYHLSVVARRCAAGRQPCRARPRPFAATGIQRLLQELLGLPEPAYFHHRLILGPDGRKLSKSFRDTGIGALREAGRTPDDVERRMGSAEPIDARSDPSWRRPALTRPAR